MNSNDLDAVFAFEQRPEALDDVYIAQLFDIYHRRLVGNPVVCDKLARRGIPQSVIESRHIGYCDRTLNRYVQVIENANGASFRGVLRRHSLTKPNGHEIFRGCIVEPIYCDGIIVAACGVKLVSPSRPAPRIIQWYREQLYLHPPSFEIMKWGQRYVAH